MKRRGSAFPYFFLAWVLFFWLNLSRSVSDELRVFAVGSFAPAWKWAKGVKHYLADRPDRFWGKAQGFESGEVRRLQLENQTLRSQIAKASEWLVSDLWIQDQIQFLKTLSLQKDGSPKDFEFFEKKRAHLTDLLRWELMQMPAEVIYRDPASWSSSLWINVGEEDNQVLGRIVIGKNSPVVLGNLLVGVIDHVGKRQSRVRLITDSGLCPSVQASRGLSQDREVSFLLRSLKERLSLSPEGERKLQGLIEWEKSWKWSNQDVSLARGELRGSSSPFWRSRNQTLIGVGFHFDSKEGAPEAVQRGDLLLTTGLDGVFPPGLIVGRVARISGTKPGGYAFELEATPAAPDFNDLKTLFVLPPLSD